MTVLLIFQPRTIKSVSYSYLRCILNIKCGVVKGARLLRTPVSYERSHDFSIFHLVTVMVSKATFYYFSAISWWSVLLVEEFGENHRFLRVTL